MAKAPNEEMPIVKTAVINRVNTVERTERILTHSDVRRSAKLWRLSVVVVVMLTRVLLLGGRLSCVIGTRRRLA